MKISLVGNNEELRNGLELTGQFNTVTFDTMEESLNSEVIVILNEEVEINTLSMTFTDASSINGKRIFYIVDNQISEAMQANIETICKTKGITCISSSLRTDQIIDFILKRIFPNLSYRNRNIITFFSADSKVGTTMTSLCTAQKFANGSKKKVMLISLGDNPASNYINMPELDRITMDEIKVQLFNKMLSSEELLGACIQENGLYVLQGPKYTPEKRYYYPEHLEFILELASKVVDLIIIDAGPNVERGMVIAALQCTKFRYLVTTQREIPRKHFEIIDNDVLRMLQIKPSEFLLIVNKYINEVSQYSQEKVADIYRMPLAVSIPDVQHLGWQAEIDKQTLIMFDHEQYNFQIQQLCLLISNQTGIAFEQDIVMKKRNFMSKISSFAGFITGG